MDEIEYKLNTNNSVLVVNAIDKLISTIKLKFKPAERQRFLLENEELKLLREKCSSKEAVVSLTACEGLLALVELGVLEIAHTMSTVVTLLPTAHNYSAIISTMTGLLVLDLKSRLTPDQPYRCQFSLKSPQHPFITVLEKNKGAKDDVFAQMQALCNHLDYIVSSNSLELLRPVFLYLTCNPQREGSLRPWQLLLSLPKTDARCSLLLACLSCQQICNPNMIERAFSAYSAVTDAAIYQRDDQYVTALLPMLARISNELVKHGRDPRPCYHLIERALSAGGARVRAAAGLTLQLLAENLPRAASLYLHDTFNLGLNIISKYDCPSISLNAFVAQSLQWLYQPSYLTASALKVAAKILDIYRDTCKEDTTLNMPNLKSNKIFQSLLYTDNQLSVIVKIHSVWERLRDDETKLLTWLNGIESINDSVKIDLLSFFYGIMMEKDVYRESVVLKALRIVVKLVDFKKDVAVELLPILVYKIANDVSPAVRLECLKAVPLMAKTKENVPTVVSILNKLKANKGVPMSFLIMLYTSLAETQVRCFPYLQEMLVDPGVGRPDDLKWEVEIARIQAVSRMCELRASSHGLELVPLISTTLNRSGGSPVPACLALRSVAALWARSALAPHSAWRALEPKLARDSRPTVQIHICKLLGELPPLASPSAEYSHVSRAACSRLWLYVASGEPAVVRAACSALAGFQAEHYVLKDVPEIYRKTVKLPASFCKTPADAARNPEDVLDYVPSEVWPEVFKYTNQAALSGVVTLVRKLIEREVKGYRSGVYHIEGKEPITLSHLPPHSVVRGVMDYFRKQATSPSYDCPEEVTLAMLESLSGPRPPLPPQDLYFLTEGGSRGVRWRRAATALAANQAKVSPSAKQVIENFVHGIKSGNADESDIILFYELLPTLTCTLPPNTLRGALERTLADAFAKISQTKAKQDYAKTLLDETLANLSSKSTNESRSKESDDLSMEPQPLLLEGESVFERQLELIRICLECDNIHDANRTLLSQLVEQYFTLISDDNVAWRQFVRTSTALGVSALERMSSATTWWTVTPQLLRKAGAVRGALGVTPAPAPLLWLNDIVDAHAQDGTEQDTSLCYMFPALLAADPAAESTREWLLQLMARAQVAFNEAEATSAKVYLFSVLVTSCAALSGHWALQMEPAALLTRGGGLAALPAAAAALPTRKQCTHEMLEWLCHTRDCITPLEAAWCQRTLLALRHTDEFAEHKIWTRLESHFGKEIIEEV